MGLFGKSKIHNAVVGQHNAQMSSLVGRLIGRSKKLRHEDLALGTKGADVLALTSSVARVKRVPIVHGEPGERHRMTRSTPFENLETSMNDLNTARTVLLEARNLSRIKYDKRNPRHETELMRLWALLGGGRQLSDRVSDDWKTLGFQGTDPATDFRGMGMLSLWSLIYYAEHSPKSATRGVREATQDPYYPWAAVGINLCSALLEESEAGRIDWYLFKSQGRIEYFYELFAVTMAMFHRFWFASKPTDLMDFPRIFGEFRTQLSDLLLESDLPREILRQTQ